MFAVRSIPERHDFRWNRHLALIFSFAVLLTGFVPLASQAGVCADAVADTQTADESLRPLMWVIRDHDSTVYLFGSIHVMCDGINWMTPGIAKRFDSADTLWLEVDDIDDKSHMAEVARRYMYNPQGHMTDGLSADEVHDLDQRLGQYDLNSQGLQGLHKWAVGLVLMQHQLAGMGLDSDNGIDATLLRRARVKDKPVHGFETIEQQMQLMSPRDDAEDLDSLRVTLKEFDETPGMVDELIAGWLSGDEATLDKYLIDKTRDEDPDGYQKYIVTRNVTWVPKIEHILAGKGVVFIAVGTAHLVGPDSVIALLKKDGIKATPVKTDR